MPRLLTILNLFALSTISCQLGVIDGQTITPVYVQSNNPVTLTCPAADQATTLTWTGPGGILYATGTRVEDDLKNSLKPRVSASHTGGSYTLGFTEFRSSDTGIYTCTVDGTGNIQMVIVQAVTSASPVYTRQEGTVTLPCPNTNGTPVWSVTSTTVIYNQGTDINPAIPDDTRARLSVITQDGNYNLQISDVQLSDVREYRCSSGVTDTKYHLLLYIPPSFPEIENTVIVNGQNRTSGTEDRSMNLTCHSLGGTPAASVSWIKDGTTLVTSDNSVQYTKVFTQADDRTVYTCQSSSPALTSPETTSVLVYLDLKPGQPTISGQLSQTENNNNLQVVCVSTGSRPAAMIQWNVGGTWQSNNPTEVKVKDIVTDTYTVTSTLSLTANRQDNGKSVYCRASNQALSGGIESVQHSITVLFGPNNVGITGNRVIVADGTNTLTLTCTTEEYNRHVHIMWYNGTTQIPNTAVVTNTSGTYGGYMSTQVLQLTPDRYQDGNVIKCVVQNEDVTLAQKTASVSLNLNYRPYLTLTPTPGVNVIEGGELEIRCDVDSNPPSSIMWTRVGGQLPSNSDVTSGILRIPSTYRTDRGTYTCTAQNSVSREEESLTIDIYYPPDIRVTYTNTTYISPDRTFTCVPDGNPDTYQFGLWRHTAEDGTEIRQLTGSSSPTRSVLTLPDPGVTRRYEDTGYYICEASNNIPSSTFYSSGSGFFVVKSPPVVITNTSVVKGQIGDNVTMEVEFYSRPEVTSGDVTWTKGTDSLSPSDKVATSVNVRSVQMSFHGVDINVEGYVAAIQIVHLVEQDFGNYTVTVVNGIGTKTYTIWLKSASPPVAPNSLKTFTYDSTTITLQWTRSFNGGAEQVFVIGYKSDISEEYLDLAPFPDTHESTQSYQITGLKSGTTHFIRMYSKNVIGKSDEVFLNQTTAAPEDETNIGPLVGGIAGSALGLIAIVVVAIVIYKRRSTAKDSDMEMINGRNTKSENKTSDGLKPNILYESSDGLKANVLYESAGADFQPQPGPSSEYAVVCKPKKKKGASADPNSLYGVVDKSSKGKNDVYAQVDKQSKGKGGKGDNVYGNISSEQGASENVYANSKDSTTVLPTPSRTRNQDGLLYLDVEFKDSSNNGRRAVIHGIENRTDYADVDFTQRADPLPAEDESVEKAKGNGKTDK